LKEDNNEFYTVLSMFLDMILCNKLFTYRIWRQFCSYWYRSAFDFHSDWFENYDRHLMMMNYIAFVSSTCVSPRNLNS